MTTMTENARRVTGGVDTHKDSHVAAALDEVGRVLSTEVFPATPAGYRRLLGWLRRHRGSAATTAVAASATRPLVELSRSPARPVR